MAKGRKAKNNTAKKAVSMKKVSVSTGKSGPVSYQGTQPSYKGQPKLRGNAC